MPRKVTVTRARKCGASASTALDREIQRLDPQDYPIVLNLVQSLNLAGLSKSVAGEVDTVSRAYLRASKTGRRAFVQLAAALPERQ